MKISHSEQALVLALFVEMVAGGGLSFAQDIGAETALPIEAETGVGVQPDHPPPLPGAGSPEQPGAGDLDGMQSAAADAAFFLGQSLYAEGWYLESVDALRKASILRPDDGAILNFLGLALERVFELGEAERVLRKALEIRRRELGETHARVAETLSNLARVLSASDRQEEADRTAARAVEIYELTVGPEHLEYAQSLLTMAHVRTPTAPLWNLVSTRKKDSGLRSTQQWYKDGESSLRTEHLVRRALEIQEKTLGKSHPAVARTLDDLAGYLLAAAWARSNLAERAKYLQRRMEAPPVPNDPAQIKSQGQSFAAVLADPEFRLVQNLQSGQYDVARSLSRRALAICERSGKGDHPDSVNILLRQAYFAMAENQPHKAWQLIQRSGRILSQAYGQESPALTAYTITASSMLVALDRLEQAERNLLWSLQKIERAFGPNHPKLAGILEFYSVVLRRQKRAPAAAEMERRAEAIRARAVLDRRQSDEPEVE